MSKILSADFSSDTSYMTKAFSSLLSLSLPPKKCLRGRLSLVEPCTPTELHETRGIAFETNVKTMGKYSNESCKLAFGLSLTSALLFCQIHLKFRQKRTTINNDSATSLLVQLVAWHVMKHSPGFGWIA